MHREKFVYEVPVRQETTGEVHSERVVCLWSPTQKDPASGGMVALDMYVPETAAVQAIRRARDAKVEPKEARFYTAAGPAVLVAA